MKRFINSFLLGALCVLAIGCAHEPEATLVDENGNPLTVEAPPALVADESDKGALENETKQMLNQETPTTVADASAADNAQGDLAASEAPAPDAAAAPLVDPLASMNPTAESPAADVVAPASTEEVAQANAVVTAPAQEMVAQAQAQEPVAQMTAEEPKVEAPAPAPAPVVKKKHKKVHAATKLNRYYFLRTGDTPEYLSKMFYGTPDKAEQLVGWNQPREGWQAGKIIYFNSATKPHDRKMRSYYEENAVAADEYVTKPGDSLAKIAEEKYGSSLSAREIAAINDLRTDAALPVGKALKLYPAPLNSDGKAEVAKKSDAELIKAEIAKVENEAKTEAAKAAPSSPVVAAAQPVPMPAPVVKDRDKASLASMEVAGFARQNPIVVVGLGALLILLGSFFVAARKRTRSRLDF